MNPFWILNFGFWIGPSNGRIISFILGLLLALSSLVEAQQPAGKIPRIGIVTGISTDPSSRIKTFRQALHELGYFEGEKFRLQPIKFELAINLKKAKQIGMTIPPNVLARADIVIK